MVQLWIDLVKESLQSVDATLPEDFDFSSLAHVSMGFSCGAIVRAVKSTLTARRLYRVCRLCEVFRILLLYFCACMLVSSLFKPQ